MCVCVCVRVWIDAYLSNDGNLMLYNALKSRLMPGTRLLTLAFPIATLQPKQTSQAGGLDLFVYEHE